MSRILFVGVDVSSVSAAASLRAAGYDVSIVADCHEAAELATPDLVVVRVFLPAQTGLSNLQAAHIRFINVPIIALAEGDITSEGLDILQGTGATRTVIYSPFAPTLPGVVASLLPAGPPP